ncbi:uncharacterized protein TNIN_469841 [Trichonephila inaurata madagascariensis]|uniref:Uncharacterized protein n=1 Tax=Trichonephila inaurata madagascariensis TaxID=2747483 RepID=A0A8X7C177_9ARAC|nr:uncharacterized protein TNIN_469841 [Trichonephila inaurata madagascariensis]
MDSLKLVHPFTLILAGPSGSGKSQFVKKLIENKMIKPFPKKIVWCYGINQTLYEEMPNISFHEDTTLKPYGYLLMDLKPETDKSLRVRTENQETSVSENQETSVSENQETESLKENLKESVVKTEKEVFEDETFRIVPARYKENAKNYFPVFKASRIFQLEF